MSTRYGAEFDSLAAQWAVIENQHDSQHPNRDLCGGVGGCSMMMAATILEQAMVSALDRWRVQ